MKPQFSSKDIEDALILMAIEASFDAMIQRTPLNEPLRIGEFMAMGLFEKMAFKMRQN